MKPWLKNRNGKSLCVYIFSEHKFWHYPRLNAASCTDINTLITTYTYNYTAYVDTYTDFYNSRNYTFFIFTNNFFPLTQLTQ